MFIFCMVCILLPMIIVAVLGIIGYAIVRSVKQRQDNKRSPRLTVPAVVVAKRTSGSDYSQPNGGSVAYTSTSYYVTFQVESGARIELYVMGQDYGMLAEGDTGRLTFQGTQYLGFDRQ